MPVEKSLAAMKMPIRIPLSSSDLETKQKVVCRESAVAGTRRRNHIVFVATYVFGCRGVDPVLQQKRIQKSLVSDPTQPRPAMGRGFLLARRPIPSWLKLLGKLRRGGCFQRAPQPN